MFTSKKIEKVFVFSFPGFGFKLSKNFILSYFPIFPAGFPSFGSAKVILFFILTSFFEKK